MKPTAQCVQAKPIQNALEQGEDLLPLLSNFALE
jgi:hypothetical protein